MFALLILSIVVLWFVVCSILVLFIVLHKPNNWLLDLNPIYFRLPLPNVNDKIYVRKKRVIECDKLYCTEIIGPKSIAVDRRHGRLYTGTLDGKLCCVELNDSNVEDRRCVRVLVHIADSGRPLGVRISANLDVVYFVEANSGLYSYDIIRKKLTHLLGMNETQSSIVDRASKFFADLAIVEEENGNTFLYVTDVSRKFDIEMWPYAYLEPDCGGRVLRYDVKNGIVTVILDGLCFPSGIEISDRHESLLVCEMTKRRILRHRLTGEETGRTTVLLDNLPGEPENIRRSLADSTETFWIGMALTRDYRQEISFIDNYCTNPNLRKLILRSTFIFGSLLYELGKLADNESWKSRGKSLKSGIALILDDMMTFPAMASEIDFDGNVLCSVQVKNDLTVMSEICEMPTTDNEKRSLYIGSSNGSMRKIVLNK